MSVIQVQGAERHHSPLPSPGLVDLASNNPFRNRAASPALPSPQSPSFNSSIPSTAPERPKSRNPFLDHTESAEINSLQQRSTSPVRGTSAMAEQKPALYGNAAILFNNLSLDDKPSSQSPHPVMAPPSSTLPLRSENVPPTANAKNSLAGHRPSRSNEEEQRLLNGGKTTGPPQRLDIFADPAEAKQRRLRRNSESSLVDKSGKLLDPDAERRRRERRHKEREARHKDAKGRIHGASSKPKKPSQRLDIIDSLDVTSIYGTGLFHHDGPFDACNPHRNRKGSQRAPMQAFAKDSANNVIGGSGPVNKNIDMAQFHGRGAEGFTDYATSGAIAAEQDPSVPCSGANAPMRSGPGVRPKVDRSTSFNPTALVDPVYGDETVGLGATTFLEGAPAPRAAIQRRESESDGNMTNGGGLSRTRSLAQKIRGINRGPGTIGRVASPDVYDRHRATSPTSPMEQSVLSAGGMPKIQETNPFFNDHDEAYEKKGAKIQIAEEKNRVDSSVGRERAMSSPKRAPLPGLLERRVTNDGTGMMDSESKSGGGFLSRVKSLRGGRRARPERRE